MNSNEDGGSSEAVKRGPNDGVQSLNKKIKDGTGGDLKFCKKCDDNKNKVNRYRRLVG